MKDSRPYLKWNRSGMGTILVALGLAGVFGTVAYFRNLAAVGTIRDLGTSLDSVEGFYAGEMLAIHTYEWGKDTGNFLTKTPVVAVPEGSIRRGLTGTDGNLSHSIRFDAANGTLSFCGAIRFPKSINDREICAVVVSPDVQLYANGSATSVTISNGSAATLSWTSDKATSCRLTGGPPCDAPTPPAACNLLNNSSLSTGNLTSDQIYVLTCSGALGYPDLTTVKQVTITVDTPLCGGIWHDGSCFYQGSGPGNPGNPSCNQICASHGGPNPRTSTAAVCTSLGLRVYGPATTFRRWGPARASYSHSNAGVCGISSCNRLTLCPVFAPTMPNYNLQAQYGNASYFCVCNQ